MAEDFTGYVYRDAELNQSHGYLLPPLREILAGATGKRLFELGCGNGAIANALAELGYEVTGVDPSEAGIAQARARYPHLRLFQGSAYDELAERYGRFPVVVSLEVVEHLYHPRRYAAAIHDLLEPGGTAIVSTPYHGYWKNLALALSGRMDSHFTALWDGGHIKFWSTETLSRLLREAGFDRISFRYVGRLPWLAKSMIAVARKGAP
jgi:2-polyprenyl-3-methyl-5-hydroxy-6-metoxy-1,4-benzoquinol methylase